MNRINIPIPPFAFFHPSFRYCDQRQIQILLALLFPFLLQVYVVLVRIDVKFHDFFLFFRCLYFQ